MTATDFAKAAATALALMVINVAMSFVTIFIYSVAIDPGHDSAYYQAMVPTIVPWSAVVFGIVLFLATGLVAARRRPARNAYAFAFACAVTYIAIDAAILFALGALQDFDAIVAVSYGTKVLAAIAGAYLGSRTRVSA